MAQHCKKNRLNLFALFLHSFWVRCYDGTMHGDVAVLAQRRGRWAPCGTMQGTGFEGMGIGTRKMLQNEQTEGKKSSPFRCMFELLSW